MKYATITHLYGNYSADTDNYKFSGIDIRTTTAFATKAAEDTKDGEKMLRPRKRPRRTAFFATDNTDTTDM
jgi:hypothetical protein